MSLSKPVFVAFKSDGVWPYFLRVKTKDNILILEYATCHCVCVM